MKRNGPPGPQGQGSWPRQFLRPLSWLYGATVVACRAWRTRPGAVVKLSIPVVSVGNLTAGGTGKGPVVRWIAERCSELGHRPVIALRGYRPGPGGSDEALEHARLVPAAVVAVGADRARAIAAARRRDPGVDVAILDDGFQHWALARDLDLVLVDATRPGLDDAMLPAGRRREPCSALARADAVIVTRCDGVDGTLAERIAAHHGCPPVAWCRHEWTSLRIMEPPAQREGRRSCSGVVTERIEPVAWLSQRRVGVIAGIGHPDALMGQVKAHAMEACWLARREDHASYDAERLRHWIQRAGEQPLDAIVTTMKDWVKIEGLLPQAIDGARGSGLPAPFVVPVVGLAFIEGEEALRAKLRAVLPVDSRRA